METYAGCFYIIIIIIIIIIVVIIIIIIIIIMRLSTAGKVPADLAHGGKLFPGSPLGPPDHVEQSWLAAHTLSRGGLRGNSHWKGSNLFRKIFR